jgi:hypothetical protein
MRVVETIHAKGHRNIRSRHRTTLEVTKDAGLTKKGDCIVATGASKGAADLSRGFLNAAKRPSARITLTIKASGFAETITGWGDGRLVLTHPTDLVARKSSYICPRTLMVRADKSAADLNTELVRVLRDESSTIKIEIVAESSQGSR